MTPAEHVAVALVVLAVYLWLAAWVHDRRERRAAEVAHLEHVAEELVLAEKDGVVVPMQRKPGGAS